MKTPHMGSSFTSISAGLFVVLAMLALHSAMVQAKAQGDVSTLADKSERTIQHQTSNDPSGT